MDEELTITSGFRSTLDAVKNGDNVFITGKAGTGKSTLLRLLSELCIDRATSVVAPTGVAALNVEGETIHSFFAFRAGLGPELRQYRPPDRLRDVDLLIVDEVSMARADLVDMMDVALRRAMTSSAPFGGIQLVLVGDLYQLPPVVVDGDTESALAGYASPFFFSAHVFRGFEFDTIELDRVFRQTDADFIRLLNRVRDGTVNDADLDLLNGRVDADFSADEADGYVTLTTTNKLADTVNRDQLAALSTPVTTSHARVSGEFDPSHYRAEETLRFAVGAQVMMLTNADEYVNGSLGRVLDIRESQPNDPRVLIKLATSGATVEVRRHTWEIMRPTRRDGTVEYETVGSFTQLPFRLAWAVTVHKSQGKTFSRVVFDRGRRVFAAGQLYVALSRCTTMEGLILRKPLRARDVITDPEVKRFHLQATAPRICAADTTRSYIGYVATGGGEFNKLAELAVIRENPAGPPLVFETLINPLRDISDAAATGIDASQVSAAPTVDELRTTIAALISGTVLVGRGLAEFHRMMGWERAQISEGLGIDLAAHLDLPDQDPTQQASRRASQAVEQATALNRRPLPLKPLDRNASTVAAGAYTLPRITQPDPVGLVTGLPHLGLPVHETVRCLLAVLPSRQGPHAEAIQQARSYAEDASGPEAFMKAGFAVHEQLVAAVARDSRVTETEARIVQLFADACLLNVEPTVADESRPITIQLVPDIRVCFTGSPAANSEHTHLTKSYLRTLAADAGLIEVKAVTKTKCELVVTLNLASMSRKAKQARAFGKPLLSAEEFVALATGQ